MDEIDSILASINISCKETNPKTKARLRKIRVLPCHQVKALVEKFG